MRRLALGALLAVAVVLTAAAPAGAHALLKRSDPANGAQLDQPPAHVTIEFTERPDPAVSVIRLFDSSGTAVPTGPTRTVAGQPRTLTTDVTRTLPKDTYTVTWRTVSREDGHVTGGSFAFGVGKPAVALPAASSPAGSASAPSPLGVAGRWLLYLGLAVLLGGALTSLLLTREPLPSRALLLAGAASAVAGSVLALAAEDRTLGLGLRRYLRTAHGTSLLRQLALCLVTAVVAAVATRWRKPPVYATLGAFAAAALARHATSGHAGAASRLRWPTVGVQWLHLLAVAAWIGALAWALLVLRGDDDARRGAVARRLSRLATVAVLVVAVTGTVRALAEVHAWRLLWSTDFGRTVLAKVALFAVLVAIGARNRFRLVPAAATPAAGRSLRRAVGVEVGFGTVVFGLSALLSGLAPATLVPVTARPPNAVVVTGSDFATSVRIRLTVTPGAVGPNAFTLVATDYDTGRPAPATRVALRFTLPGRPDLQQSTLELARTASGAWSGSGPQLSVDGRWHVVVVLEAGANSVEVPLDMTTALPPETLRVDRTPGQATLYTATLPDGSSVQTYLDPDVAGFTEVHLTFFARGGGERPIATLQVTATPPSGTARAEPVRTLGPGHFVADATLTAGTWHLSIRATARDAAVLRAYADVEVRKR